MSTPLIPSRSHGLLLILIVTGFAFSWKLRPKITNATVRAAISQQNDGVETIDSPRNNRYTDTILLDVIKFDERETLVHASLGRLGFNQNFFIDFTGRIEILKPMTLKVVIASDDGFRLFFGETRVCEWVPNRAYAETDCYVRMVPGKLNWKLSYFQGGGPLGLEARYQPEENGRSYLFGHSSELVKFLPEKLSDDTAGTSSASGDQSAGS